MKYFLKTIFLCLLACSASAQGTINRLNLERFRADLTVDCQCGPSWSPWGIGEFFLQGQRFWGNVYYLAPHTYDYARVEDRAGNIIANATFDIVHPVHPENTHFLAPVTVVWDPVILTQQQLEQVQANQWSVGIRSTSESEIRGSLILVPEYGISAYFVLGIAFVYFYTQWGSLNLRNKNRLKEKAAT